MRFLGPIPVSAITAIRRTESDAAEAEGRHVFTRITGATLRAVLAGLLIAMPTLLLAPWIPEHGQIVAIIGLVIGAITFSEYYVQFPSMIEFRYAPPYNRLRFGALVVNVGLLCLLVRADFEATPLSDMVMAVGLLIGEIIDFSFSPVRLVGVMLPPDATLAQVEMLRAAAGISYLCSLIMVAVFAIFMRLYNWPASQGTFNVWINLPNFDATAGADVVRQILRDSRINVLLGLSLPFVTPLFAMFGAAIFDPYMMAKPQGMIWTVAIWAFIPASLMMRGIALARIADMLSRRRVQLRDAPGYPAF